MIQPEFGMLTSFVGWGAVPSHRQRKLKTPKMEIHFKVCVQGLGLTESVIRAQLPSIRVWSSVFDELLIIQCWGAWLKVISFNHFVVLENFIFDSLGVSKWNHQCDWRAHATNFNPLIAVGNRKRSVNSKSSVWNRNESSTELNPCCLLTNYRGQSTTKRREEEKQSNRNRNRKIVAFRFYRPTNRRVRKTRNAFLYWFFPATAKLHCKNQQIK